jgi:hypothetical protein
LRYPSRLDLAFEGLMNRYSKISVKQSISLTLDRRIGNAAKVFAARQQTKVSVLLADELKTELHKRN